MATTTSSKSAPREWQQLVTSTEKRNGVIELRPDPAHHDVSVDKSEPHRVRLIRVEADGWIVERPFSTKGQVSISTGMYLLGVLGVGAARWGFQTKAAATQMFQLNADTSVPVLKLALPTKVQSAQRRAYFRVPMVSADQAGLKAWPLMDLRSAIPAERANMMRHKSDGKATPAPASTPQVGEPFSAQIVDVSAGGLAAITPAESASMFAKHKLFWLQLTLPGLSMPLTVSAQLIRVSQEPSGALLLAFGFTFKHNRAHEDFITDTLCRIAAAEQRRQLQRQR